MSLYSHPDLRTAQSATPDPLPTYHARDLVHEGAQARLVLDGTADVLRITRAGKLILTK